MNARISFLLPLFLMAACDGRGEDTGKPADTGDTADTNDTDTADTDTADTDTGGDEQGFSVSGTAIDLMSASPAAEGLSVAIADPTPALAGGELDILGTSTTAADGTFTVTGVETTATLGLFMVVSGGDNMNTATGIAASEYSSLGDGDAITGKSAYVVSNTMQVGIDQSAALLGYAGTIATDGVVFIAIRDASGNPVDGAVVSCGDCGASIYYMDGDSSDGLFTTGGAPNEGTVAAAGALAVVPAGPIATYEASTSTLYGGQLTGSLPALASFVNIVVE